MNCIFNEKFIKMYDDIGGSSLYCLQLYCVSTTFDIIIIGPITDLCKLGRFKAPGDAGMSKQQPSVNKESSFFI